MVSCKASGVKWEDRDVGAGIGQRVEGVNVALGSEEQRGGLGDADEVPKLPVSSQAG